MSNLWGSARRVPAVLVVIAMAVCLVPLPVLASGVWLAEAGSISGTVRDESGVPLEGIPVSSIVRVEGEQPVPGNPGLPPFLKVHTETVTDETGAYTLSDLEPGAYGVLFSCGEYEYIDEFHDDATIDDLTFYELTAGETVSGIDTTLTLAGHITGTVRDDSGDPIGGITVTSYRNNGSLGWGQWIYDVTAADGTYDIGGLASDTYRLSFFDSVGTYLGEYYDDVSSVEAATDLMVISGEMLASIDATLALRVVEPVPIAGDSRYETAVEASKEAFPDGADTVVIATGMNWPDALGGAALAGALDGPILLTRKQTLPDAVIEEVERLEATEAIILGGTAAVSQDVEDALEALLAAANVSRIGGADRYETAHMIAEATVDALGSAFEGTAFVATGGNFPDALAASPISAARGWPLYLASSSGLSASTKASMARAGVSDVVILGGTAVVSQAIEDELALLYGEAGVGRYAGLSRYETAVEVATFGVDRAGLSWDGVAFATGQDYPDALAGGVLQGKAGSVMLLTAKNDLAPAVADVLEENRAYITRVVFLGGLNAVSEEVRAEVLASLE